jgi:acyl carrier protein
MLIPDQAFMIALGRIQNVIAEESTISLETITATARLEEDLKISGESLVDLIDTIFAQFHVQIGDFSYKKYCARGVSSERGLSSLVQRLRGTPETVRKSVTVAMLAQAAIDGVWNCARLDSLTGTGTATE